jgi:arylsulfatase A-like enzyme
MVPRLSYLIVQQAIRFFVLTAMHVAACGVGNCLVAAERPNVVVILADDLGFSDIGCYGGEIQTPNLDRLAMNGLRFTQFYNTARCWPTRGSLLTGYYAQQIRRDALDKKLPGQGQRPAWAPLLPQRLQPLGYRSYISGKWHVDGDPLKEGFDRSYILDDHDRYFAPRNHRLDGQALPTPQLDENYYATTEIANRAIEFLSEHQSQHGDKPFFAYVAFTSPHFPLHARAEDIAKYQDAYKIGWDGIRQNRSAKQKALGLMSSEPGPLESAVGPPYRFKNVQEQLGSIDTLQEVAWESLDETHRVFQAQKMATHAAMVDRMDQEIGRIVDQLSAMKCLDNTILFFLSDNGASAEVMIRGDGHDQNAAPGSASSFLCLGPGWSRAANTPFRRHKTWVHEGGISTPLVVHWPAGKLMAGGLRTQTGHVIDLVPTIVELCGGQVKPADPATPKLAGESLAKVLTENASLDQRDLWWLHEGNRAVRRENWKLVASHDQPWELYDLANDRSESVDLASQNPDLVKKLTEAWQAMFEKVKKDAALP